jgi:hypothetical protein
MIPRLLHYSDQYITAVETVEQRHDAHLPFKPRGLWVTTPGEDDWPSWCWAESFHTERLTHATEVILAPTARILHLDTPELIQGFHALHAKSLDDSKPELAFSHGMAVDWEAVGRDYDGILIMPYQWSLRLDPDVQWYYPWDCNSGCIWNAGAVARLVPVIPQIAFDKTNAQCQR